MTINAQAMAQTTTSYGSIGGCIFALAANNETDALNLESGTTLNSSCSAISESNATEAFKMNGSDIWNMTSHNAHVAVVGGIFMNGSAQIIDATVTPNVTEVPITNYTNPGDPLINVTAPTPGTVTGGVQQSAPVIYKKNHMATLSPGIYCGGITMSNTGGETLRLRPRTYILAGGGLSLGSQAQIAGTGVAFYSTSSTGWGCPTFYAAGSLGFNGQAVANFTAPTTGSMCGMLFFQDRSIDPGTSIIVGWSTSTFDGAIYLKKSALRFVGNNSTTGYMVLERFCSEERYQCCQFIANGCGPLARRIAALVPSA